MTTPPVTAAVPETVPIAASHADLLTRPVCGVLTTIGPGGWPESSLVWVDLIDGRAAVNTTLERRKGRNLVADPRLSLMVVDPEDTGRFLQIRGDAELDTDRALEHVDMLTGRYTGRAHYYGGIYPPERQDRETRVIVRVLARRITLDAIHA